jgi:cytochrome P450
MSTVEQASAPGKGGWPFVRYEELNVPKTDALWHFTNFDRLRTEAPAYFGEAAGNAFWLLTRIEDIRAAYQQPEVFSSSAVVPTDPEPSYLWIPEMLDPPLHTKWRQLLGPTFSPGAVASLQPRVEQRFAEILDDIAPRGRCDYVADVALRFPNTIFMEIMGLPVSEAEQFQAWETAILHGRQGEERTFQAMNEVVAYFAELIAERRSQPRDDLLSSALGYRIDGEPVSDNDLLAMCLLLFMAGLDTVAAQLSYSTLHLATHEDDRQRLVDDPSLFPTAIEEFLRYYSFVTPSRKITTDVEFHGCPMKAGEMVHLPLVSANRDPAEFPDAERVVIDRPDNRHIAFGAGPHRCLGSHLARQELRIGLTAWHARIPRYRLDPNVPIREHGGQIGLDNLPLEWEV